MKVIKNTRYLEEFLTKKPKRREYFVLLIAMTLFIMFLIGRFL